MLFIIAILPFALAVSAQTRTAPLVAASNSASNPATTVAAAGAAVTSSTVDACGPAIPDPTVEDSCDTPVQLVESPNAYGVQCLNDTESTTQLNLTTCATLIPQLCSNQWQLPGQWLWLSGEGCSLGSFLPPYPGSATWPSGPQCEELLYVAMVENCEYDGTPFNIAAVNLKTLPDDTAGGKGAAVNVGYGSYLVAERQLRNLSDAEDCIWIPPDNYCRGSGCYPPSYYVSKYSKPTPCAALGSAAPVFQTAAPST